MSNGRMGTELDTIESRLVRVTTSKRAARFQIWSAVSRNDMFSTRHMEKIVN